MAVDNPVKVPKRDIGSIDIPNFAGGWFFNTQQNAKKNQLVSGKNVVMTLDGLLGPRKSLQKWLPDTVEAGYDICSALVDGEIYNFTADDGKIRYIQEGDDDWSDCGGDNEITTQNGGKTILLRALNAILVINGGNGDKLCYVDLTSPTFDVVKYTLVDDPDTVMTAAATGITASGDYKIYYGYTYSGAVGETKLSPILTQAISKPRDNWDSDGSEYLTISRPDFGSEPAGSKKWNLYVALAPNGATIEDTDMLLLAGGLDLNQESVVDNGTLAIDVGRGNPPSQNSTDGPRCKYALETNGRPILYGDVDAPYNIWIGGDGEFALDFSASNGGYRAEVSKGTNYYPASIIGFRNGQGIPSLTILFSNTQGLSKQATLEQQTVNYGNQSFVVWGVTEQNYGAAGIASPLGAVNYRGQLSFPSTDGITTMDTQPQLQNVIATKSIDRDIKEYTRRFKVSALGEIVGTGWADQLLWIVPANGFDTPNEILIRDLNNDGNYNPPLKIPAQWIGTVSPPDSPAFVFIRQGTKILKLFESFGTVDYKGGGAENFETSAKGALLGVNDAHNAFQTVIQAVFYLIDIIGDITVGVNYRDRDGEMQTVTETYNGPKYVKSFSGGWSDPQYTYANFDAPAGWDAISQIDESASALERETERVKVPINDLASELQWFISTPEDYCDYKLKSVSFEGENLGVKPDLI